MKSTDVTISHNYVLVKPDPDFKHYHVGGKETSIIIPVREVDHAHHVSISGIVMAIPNHLVYNGHIIEDRKIDFFDTLSKFMEAGEGEALPVAPEDMTAYSDLKRESVAFEVPIEVVPGDRVFFSYSSHYQAAEVGGVIDTTDHGRLILIKYDSLVLAQGKDGKVKPINGYLIIEPLSVDTEIVDGIVTMKRQDEKTGVPILMPMLGTKWLGTRRWQLGVIRYAGSPCNSYIDFLQKGPDPDELQVGDVIIYNKLLSIAFESHYHVHLLGGIRAVKIQRKDVYGKFNKPLAHVKAEMTKTLWLKN